MIVAVLVGLASFWCLFGVFLLAWKGLTERRERARLASSGDFSPVGAVERAREVTRAKRVSP